VRGVHRRRGPAGWSPSVRARTAVGFGPRSDMPRSPRSLGSEPSPPRAPPKRVRGAYRRRLNPRHALDPLRLLRPSVGNRAHSPRRVSHKRRKGLNPRAEPCVASIDAADLPGEALWAGLEPRRASDREAMGPRVLGVLVRSPPLRALPPSASAAPIGAVSIPATPSTPCAFCGHPPGTERTRHAELATKGARNVREGAGRNVQHGVTNTLSVAGFGQTPSSPPAR